MESRDGNEEIQVSDGWDALPFPILKLLISHCAIRQDPAHRRIFGAMRLVNHHWNDCTVSSLTRLLVIPTSHTNIAHTISRKFPKVRTISMLLDGRAHMDCQSMNALSPMLTTLAFEGELVTNAQVQFGSHLTNLVKFSCSRSPVDDAGLSILASLTKLTRIDLRMCKRVYGNFGEHFPPNLRHLNLSGTSVGSFMFDMFFSNLSKLTYLNLGSNSCVMDFNLAMLTDLVSLETFDFGHCEHLEMKEFSALSGLTRLQTLEAANCRSIRYVGCQSMALVTSLTHLDLTDCVRVGNWGLQFLEPLNNLQVLILNGCDRISDIGMENLACIPSLTHLSLGYCYRISDRGVSHLACSLSCLTHLSLVGCRGVGNLGLRHIGESDLDACLRVLELASCDKVSNKGLGHLLSLTSLEKLDVSNCAQILDSGISILAPLSKLRVVNVVENVRAKLVDLNELKTWEFLDTMM